METLKLSENVRQFLASFGYVIKNRRQADNTVNALEVFLLWAFIVYFNAHTLSFGSAVVYFVFFVFCSACIFYAFKVLFLLASSRSHIEKLAYQAYVFWLLQYFKRFNSRYAFLLPMVTAFLLLLNGYLLPAVLFICSVGFLWSMQKNCYPAAVEIDMHSRRL